MNSEEETMIAIGKAIDDDLNLIYRNAQEAFVLDAVERLRANIVDAIIGISGWDA